ncbi:MAG: hypothetical protein K8U57_18930 [Planctomycetes bacterium]|nr:hypothetical protein [Planctomycetota bacterium]
MPKQFDAALKDLICSHPVDWLTQLGVPITAPPEVISADLSAVTAAADTLLRVGKLVVHIDVESGPDESLAERMLLYNVLARHHTKLPVRTIAVLLRSNAQRANLTDEVNSERLSFKFQIVRVWELPADDLLKAGIGLTPLALLGKPPKGQSRQEALPQQVERIVDRARAEAGPRAGEVVTAAFILAGMHTAPDIVRTIFQGVTAMIESSAFQVIEDWAKERHMREILLKQGTIKFGAPTEDQAAKLAAIDNLPRLDRLAERLIKVDSWEALLRGR